MVVEGKAADAAAQQASPESTPDSITLDMSQEQMDDIKRALGDVIHIATDRRIHQGSIDEVAVWCASSLLKSWDPYGGFSASLAILRDAVRLAHHIGPRTPVVEAGRFNKFAITDWVKVCWLAGWIADGILVNAEEFPDVG